MLSKKASKLVMNMLKSSKDELEMSIHRGTRRMPSTRDLRRMDENAKNHTTDLESLILYIERLERIEQAVKAAAKLK